MQTRGMFSSSLLLALEPPRTATAPWPSPSSQPSLFLFLLAPGLSHPIRISTGVPRQRSHPTQDKPHKDPKQPKVHLLILYSRARPYVSWVVKSTGSTGDARVKEHFRISRLYVFHTRTLSRD
ncbi:hypothetical protein DFH29DRAFT_944906 [Suillus ampliporus]|nr:hypothetical protein DFH29DRAFT_944906 [Suillus ampliporus]